MSGKWTKGPWWAEVDDGDTSHSIRAAVARYPLARVASYWTGETGLPTAETRAANAALIAASPALYDALEAIVANLKATEANDGHKPIWRAAFDALSLARGEQ